MFGGRHSSEDVASAISTLARGEGVEGLQADLLQFLDRGGRGCTGGNVSLAWEQECAEEVQEGRSRQYP